MRATHNLGHNPSLIDKNSVTQSSAIYIEEDTDICGQTNHFVDPEQKSIQQTEPTCCCCTCGETLKPPYRDIPQEPYRKGCQNKSIMLDSPSESSLVTLCGCDKKSTISTAPQASLLAVDEDKKHQSATNNQKNVHSYNKKEQQVPERGRDRQRLPELSECSSFSQDLREGGSTYSNSTEAGYGHQTDCCNCDCPSQRSKYKNPSRESAGHDHAYIKDLENIISTASLNGEVAKFKGLSASIKDKLSAAVSCGTSVMSVMGGTSNGYLSAASSKSKSPSSQLKQKSSSLLFNHQFSGKSPSTKLVAQSSNSIRQSIPQSQSSFRTSTSQTKNSLRHLTPQSKRTFIQSKSSFKPSSPQRRGPFKPSSPQPRSPLRLSPFPSKNSLKPSKSPLTKHPWSESHYTPSIINLEKSSSQSKSNKHNIGPSESALRPSESSFFPLRQFDSPLKQSESSFFPLRQFESPLKQFESSLRQSEKFLQKSEIPARQSESPLKKSETYLNHLHTQPKSPFKRSSTHFKSQSTNTSKNVQTKSRSSLESIRTQSKKEAPFKKALQSEANNSTRLQSGGNTPFKQSEVNYSLNYIYSRPEDDISTVKNVYHKSRGTSPLTYSRQKTEANSQPKPNSATIEHVRHRSKTNILLKPYYSKTEANSSSSPQSEVIHSTVGYVHGSKANSTPKLSNPNFKANSSTRQQSRANSPLKQPEPKGNSSTLKNFRHRSRSNTPSKHFNLNSEANSSTKNLSAQFEPKASSTIEHVRHRSRANSSSKQFNPNSETSNSIKYLSAQSDAKSSTRHRSRANSPSKYFNPNSEANSSSKYLSAQSEPKVISSIEHNQHRSRVNSPSKHFNQSSEANSASKYLSAQSEPKVISSTEHNQHRSRANSPSKHFNQSSGANSFSKYLSAQSVPKVISSTEHNQHRSRASSPSKHFNQSSEANSSSKYLSAQFEAKSSARHQSRGNSPLKITEPAANSTLEHVRHVRSRSNSATKHSNPNSKAGSSSKYFSAQSEANRSGLHQFRANSPSKTFHPKSERNYSLKQTEPSNSTLKRFTSRSRANNLLKLYPSRKNFPKPNLRQSVTNNSLKYLSAQFQRPANDSTLKRTRSWEHGVLKRPSRVYTSSDSISISSSPPSLNEKNSTQSLPKLCTKEIGCQSQFETQANESALKRSLSLSRLYSPLKTTPANITLNITIPTQTEKKSSLKSVLSARTVLKPCTKEVGCQKENDHTNEDDVRKSNLSTLKAVLNQTFNPVRQAAGFQDSQTQTELSVLKTRSKSTSTNKTASLISMRQMAGYQSDNLKKNPYCKCQCKCEKRKEETILPRALYEDEILPRKSREISILPDYQSDNSKRNPCCKCQCKCEQRKEETILPRVLYEDEILPRKNKEMSILPDYQSDNLNQNPNCQCQCRSRSLSPKKSVEEFLPRKSREEDILPSIFQEEEISPRKSREEEILPRKSIEDDFLPKQSREEDILPRRSKDEETLSRKSREEDGLSRKSREEEILPRNSREEDSLSRKRREEDSSSRKSREEDSLSRKSREEDSLSRKSREEDGLSRKSRAKEEQSILPRRSTKQSFVGRDTSDDIAEKGLSIEEKKRSTLSNESSIKSSKRSALESDEPSILRRQYLRNSPNLPECKCKCVQVTPSLLDVPDTSLSKTKQFSIMTSDAPNDAQITYETTTKSKSKTKTPKKSGCDNPAYYPPILDCNVLVRNPNFNFSSISKPAPSPSCILVKNCLLQNVSSKTNIQNKQINSNISESSSYPNNSSCNRTACAGASQSQSDQLSSHGCNSDCCPYKSSTGRRPSARQTNDNFNDYSENRLSDTPNPARIQVLANSKKGNNQELKLTKQSAATQADLKKSNSTNITFNSKNQRTRCQSENAEQIQCKFGTQNPTSIQVLAVSRTSNTQEPEEQEGSRKSIQEEPKVVQQILVESSTGFDYADDVVTNSSLTKICKNVHDYPELTPLERPNAIEVLKKELICTFPTTCACNPCFKIYPKTGCSCKIKQNNNKKHSCCSSSARTQLVCLNNQSSHSKLPFHKKNYCYNPGCCPAQDCTSEGKAPLVCCTIDPFEALRKLNQKPKPVCQEKCIIEELLAGDCNRSTDNESDCNCNYSCNCNSSDTLVTDNSDGYRSAGGNDCTRKNDCCQPKSHLDPICCCCCTYPSNNTDVGFWAQQVAINNISALPCAKQSADPENGAEKITGENCVPPCRCCCKNRKRPAAPNYCRTKSCCTETSPCCSESQSLSCNGDEEDDTESDCCCCCSQTPCCCTIDTTAPGPICFYCKSLPCRCCDEESDSSNSVCRCKGGGTMSNDYDYSTEKDCSVRVAVRSRRCAEGAY